ncbi:hypothetical protein PR202_gb19799 [Eleusine coracana subsp. coracana]|uniref:Potassium transporter n=1 Tax=Eleusine coracana subsp. coracana TaxID=191504 RepID=A0AAV5F6X3_ELECO|nr:hypothetical protein PR202_gb19799 [Eleusine coracana subsp. coracana]
MDLEFGRGLRPPKRDSWKTTLLLAYQSLGVVYGDLSISPLYVYKSTFAEDIQHSETNEEIFGVLSFVFWTLTLIPLIKYVSIVLRADDNGEGGTFALYSLICRHANVSLLPNRQIADEELSTYKLERPPDTTDKSRIKVWLEKHRKLRVALLIMVMIGTCMVIGDGVLTPAISVFSAVSGLEFSLSKDHREFYISSFGLINIFYMQMRANDTGSEAMFADLGHFSYSAIQLAFTCLVYPALILAYMGQAAYLSTHHDFYSSSQVGFYIAVPDKIRWPVLVLAILASVVGSQAIISGTFSIINQSQSLSCFPRVKVVHTSEKIHGQIYIPEINWLLMILCIAVTVGFRDTKHMGNASGLAVITVMLVTTFLTSLVIVLCWHRPPILALAFLLFFGSIEALYFSASLIKFLEGAWLPILLALILMSVMLIWHYTTIKKYEFDLHNKVTLEWLLALGDKLGMVRVPGIGLVYTDLTSGVPANFSRFVTNLPAFHRVLVFVCVKAVPVPHVLPAERYLVGRVGPPGHRSYRCIVRYGYRDVHQDVDSFEAELVESLAAFVRMDASFRCSEASMMLIEQEEQEQQEMVEMEQQQRERRLTVVALRDRGCYDLQHSAASSAAVEEEMREGTSSASAGANNSKQVRFFIDSHVASPEDKRVAEELEELAAAREAGTAFILGHSHVQCKPGSSLFKRMAVDVGYNFLSRNCRGTDVALRVPPASLLEVGMVYVL